MSNIMWCAFLVLFIPGLAVALVYNFLPKFLWVIPALALLIIGLLFFGDINSVATEATFAEKLRFYFHNDLSMGLYLIYLPVLGSSLVFSVAAYIVRIVSAQSKAERS